MNISEKEALYAGAIDYRREREKKKGILKMRFFNPENVKNYLLNIFRRENSFS